MESNSENYTDWSGWQQTPPEISIEVSSPAKITRTDSVVDIQIILTNQSNNEISIGAGKSFSSQLEFDIAIVNQENQKIWSRFPDDATYTLEMYTIHLKSGESYKMKLQSLSTIQSRNMQKHLL
ncbi:MAG: BsuPI-related putative proteinase inhibitor [Chloroflexota bacterium]|nr:BsuPI-related putative proteinase inhibitor [Chloroflexota bacterium]